MRNTFIAVFIALLHCKTGSAQYANIPDSTFRNFLLNLYPSCFNAAGQMDTTCSNILDEKRLDCRGIAWVADFTGIQYFKTLRYFSCRDHLTANLTNITLPNTLDTFICRRVAMGPLSFPPHLITLDCSSAHYDSLPALPSSLLTLNCGANSFSPLPPLPPQLKILDCSGVGGGFGQDSLPDLPATLIELDCSSNHLTQLPVLPATLTILDCSGNNLTSLPVLPDGLVTLSTLHNQLSSLPQLPSSVNNLYVAYNQLTSLPLLPTSLGSLNAGFNQLTSLPALPVGLYNLDASNNALMSLPAFPPILTYVYLQKNNLTCLPNLTGPYIHFYIDDKIRCLPNIPPSTSITLYPPIGVPNNANLPLCSPTNNANHCTSFPVIAGHVFVDLNNNGIKDADEVYRKNVRINLSNGQYGFSNNTGQYEVGADSIGTYTLSVTAPQYYNVAPTGAVFNFTTYDTLVIMDIALQPNTNVSELAVHITPINAAARPGFSYPYLVIYENTGNTNLSPIIEFDYDETKLNYNTSSVAGVLDNTQNLTFSPGLLVPGGNGSFIGYFMLKATAALGDSLKANASISTNSFSAYDNVQTIIHVAFDPNDKQATPQLSPSQISNGEYIDYTIRFQNTGTDTAFTVVISDTLSDDLQANTLQMIASSHNCKATVKDNVAFFEFINILLPDSNVNEPKSHGFVSFRIKPQTTVSANTTITNKAAIYFDYNAPVITNTAGTLIKEFTVVPLKLISFSAVPQNDNTVLLYWNTANEINTKHFVIERSNDGLRFNSIASVFAKGKANNNYNTTVADANTTIVFYRLKIVDNDGTFSYSPVIKIDKRKNAAGFSILSNPVKDLLIVSTTDRTLSNTPATIINMQGAVVKTFVIKEGTQTVEIKDLADGVYYLRTANGSNRFLVQ